MRKTITIEIKDRQITPQEEIVEEYEKRDRNLLKVEIFDTSKGGSCIADPRYLVQLRMNRDAMIGLGTELIRMAYQRAEEKDFDHCHCVPIKPGNAVQEMGIYIYPKSCELIITEDDLGTVGDALTKHETGEN